MFLLILYLLLALGVSFFCSILEAVILSVTPSHIEVLEQQSPKTAATLRNLKSNIDQPLAAILSLNTIAHTVGAAGVGAQALVVFGNAYVAVTSGVLTFLILIFSEIIPKTIGAFYWKNLVGFTVRVLPILVRLLYPLVLLSKKISKWLTPKEPASAVSREELDAMTQLVCNDGLVTDQESRILKSLMSIGKLSAKDIMTPRTVVFSLPADMTVGEVMNNYPVLRFSRIPIYDKDQEDIRSFVLKDEIIVKASERASDTKLSSLNRDLLVIPEVAPVLTLYQELLDNRAHIALAVDEYGAVEGIVTMEDVIETFLGIEIVDETDATVDMQAMARQQWLKRARKLGIVTDDDTTTH